MAKKSATKKATKRIRAKKACVNDAAALTTVMSALVADGETAQTSGLLADLFELQNLLEGVRANNPGVVIDVNVGWKEAA